jgi:hypothetical protein
VVNRVADVVQSILFRFHRETLGDVLIRAIRKALLQGVTGLTNKAGIDELTIAFADAGWIEFAVAVREKLINL